MVVGLIVGEGENRKLVGVASKVSTLGCQLKTIPHVFTRVTGDLTIGCCFYVNADI